VRSEGRKEGRQPDSLRYDIAKRPSRAAGAGAEAGAEAGDDGYSGDSEREVSRAEAYKLQVLKRWRTEARERRLSSLVR
jgi:hypothetical protein